MMDFSEKHLMSEAIRGKGVKKDKDGYVLIRKPSHPFANASGYVREHRLVMEHFLKRYLARDEHVHHINGKKDDNSIDNLELMTKGEHTRHHNLNDFVEGRGFKQIYDINEMKELYLKGHTTREVADILGVSYSNVGYHIRKLGISRPRYIQKKNKDPKFKREVS